MIQTDLDYQKALQRIRENETFFEMERKTLAKEGKTAEQIQRYLDPSCAMIQDLKDDVYWYENAKKGQIPLITNFLTLGRSLIALRIANNMTQEELARKLGVVQSQVSRDESNEYHGISMDQVHRIVAVFGATLESKLIMRSPQQPDTTHGRKAA